MNARSNGVTLAEAASSPIKGLPGRPSKERSDAFPAGAKSDRTPLRIDPLDCLCRDQQSVQGEEAGANAERVGQVGSSAVHRTFDLPYEPTVLVGDDEAGRAAKIRLAAASVSAGNGCH